MSRIFCSIALAAGLFCTGPVMAGPVSDFEVSMRDAYADYRSALFLTNSGKVGAAIQALDAFMRKWSVLTAADATPPPQYADDTGFRQTLDAVAAAVAKARTEAQGNSLSKAHETLEGVRNQISNLHERNGIIGFSDRMNAYHAEMEAILGTDYAALGTDGMGRLREDAAVLSYLAAAVAAHPPPESVNPSYKPLLDGLLASAAALRDAARTGDIAAARPAIGALKPAYSRFFLMFG